MFNTYSEYAHEHKYQNDVGTIEVNTTYVTRRKPAWLVLLKVAGLAIFVAVFAAIAYPSLNPILGPLKSIAIIAGTLLIYTGLAFFIRPEPCEENLGYHGGMYNDPFKYSDNINRGLRDLHLGLGPGRYAVETLLDLCVLLGLARGEEVLEAATEETNTPVLSDDFVSEGYVMPPPVEIVPMKVNRFEDL